MDKKYICSVIIKEMDKLKKRISELEQKGHSISNQDATELDVLKEYYNFNIFEDVLQLIRDDTFSSLENLHRYLRDEIDKCDVPEDRSETDEDDIQVYTLTDSNSKRLMNLDSILFSIEFI